MKSVPLALCAVLLSATTASAIDKQQYKKIVAETVSAIESGSVDVDAMIANQERLVQLGVEGAREYGAMHGSSAALMNFVADRAPAMMAMTLDEIEAQWHEGAALNEIGLDFRAIDHFGPEIGLMDSIVHPATALIALNAYRDDGSESHLDQVVDELFEVVEHLEHID